VIFTRDVIFNKTTFFNSKWTNLSDKFIAEMDILIKKVKLPKFQARNKALLKEDKEVLIPAAEVTSDNNNKPI